MVSDELLEVGKKGHRCHQDRVGALPHHCGERALEFVVPPNFTDWNVTPRFRAALSTEFL
jgi:hypothetical protein